MGIINYYDDGEKKEIYLNDYEEENFEPLYIGKFHWIDWYLLAENYFEHYGNLLVPTNFSTFDGFTYNEKGHRLGYWIEKQRKIYKRQCLFGNTTKDKLSDYQLELLDKIGMIYDKWKFMYDLASKFYEHNKNLNIALDFKTKDGFTYDENGYRLGKWLDNQKEAYSNIFKANEGVYSNIFKTKDDTAVVISIEHLKKLKLIGFNYGNEDDIIWFNSFKKLKAYYEQNGTTDVPYDFITEDGITGKHLRVWIEEQIELYEKQNENPDSKVKLLSDEKISMLEGIGMIFNFFDNERENQLLLQKYNIVIQDSLFVLTKSNLELRAKIDYLLDNSISPSSPSGISFLYMTDLEMKKTFGFNLSFLIERLNKKKKSESNLIETIESRKKK